MVENVQMTTLTSPKQQCTVRYRETEALFQVWQAEMYLIQVGFKKNKFANIKYTKQPTEFPTEFEVKQTPNGTWLLQIDGGERGAIIPCVSPPQGWYDRAPNLTFTVYLTIDIKHSHNELNKLM